MTSSREISQALTDRIGALCGRLLPMGQQRGHRWIDAHVRQGGLGSSLQVEIAGAKAGSWYHHATATGGGPLELIAYLERTDRDGAIDWARAWLGGAHAEPRATNGAKVSRALPPGAESADQVRARKRQRAGEIWDRARAIVDTPGEAYLAGRGLARLHFPPSLRYEPRLWHDFERAPFPGIVAAVRPPDLRPDGSLRGGALAGIWRIYLGRGPGDSWVKAPIEEPRLGLGGKTGCAVWLGRFDGAAPMAQRLAIAEGVETALSVQQRYKAWPTAAALDAGNLAALVDALPDTVEEILIGADHDPERRRRDGTAFRPGQDGARAALFAARRRGMRASVIQPGIEGADFNDLVRGPARMPAATTARGNDAS